MLLECERALAAEAAAALLLIDPAEVGEQEIHDTLAELINMVGGNLKSLLPQPNDLGLPQVGGVPGEGYPVRVGLMSQDQPLWVSLRGAGA